jgi:hypothetical protein
MLGYKKRQQAIRKEVLNSIFDKPLLDTIQNEKNIKEKEENLQTVKKKRFMEKVTISEGIDVLETDPDKKNKMKTSGFLLTLNTNKNKAVINTELLNVEDNDDGNYGYEEICKKLEVHVIKKLHKKSYFVPKLYGATIIEPLWDEIRDLIVQLHAEPGAWEESGEGNGRKIHIHITGELASDHFRHALPERIASTVGGGILIMSGIITSTEFDKMVDHFRSRIVRDYTAARDFGVNDSNGISIAEFGATHPIDFEDLRWYCQYVRDTDSVSLLRTN